MKHLANAVEKAVKKVFNAQVEVELSRPDEQFGDYTTNVAMQLAGQLKKAPRQIAEELVSELKQTLGDETKDITIAGPGFINFTLADSVIFGQVASVIRNKPVTYKGKTVVTEYSDPNPFKVLHAGHLYTSVIGDAISNLIEAAGATVHRTNFGGDVGLHVAKAMWAMLRDDTKTEDAEKTWKFVENLASKPLQERSRWMADRYVVGNEAYENDAQAKLEIVELNKRVYQLHENAKQKSPFARVYWTCRDWSYEYFDSLYESLGVHPFEKYYPESQTAPLGIKTVREQQRKGVYKESDGAIVFKGEPHGLHTRVFINSAGLPTYEAKDVGLLMAKWRDYHFDLSLVITGNDIIEYMKVVLKSIEQFQPELTARSVHLTHGMVKLEGGVKMSSRKGNFLLATDVLAAAQEAATQVAGHTPNQTALAAVKYAFLKQRVGGDIIYNPQESVSLEGNSGPYLQYAHARARSILAKADEVPVAGIAALDLYERSLARKIGEYPDVLQKSLSEFLPHHICTYLYELSQTFNRFYEYSRVVGDPRESLRLQLVTAYADVLKDGLGILGIEAPERL